MLGLGTPELIAIGVIVLVVLGPERLPKVIITFRKWWREFQHTSHVIRQSVERELHEVERGMQDVQVSLSKDVQAIEQAMQHSISETSEE